MNNSLLNFNNRTIVITGGNKGLGRDMAITFAKQKANIVIIGRDTTSLNETSQLIKDLGGEVLSIQTDIAKKYQYNEMITEIIGKFGSIDVLINNAGMNIPKSFFDVTENDWDQIIDLNLKSVFFFTQAIAREMIKVKNGTIINISSQMAFVGYYNRSVYCTSKGGITQFTKALAVELAQHNIRVNAVAPTFVETELTKSTLQDTKLAEDIHNKILLDGLAQPADISNAVLFLASPMANFITGETLKVDGGWTVM